MKDYYLGLDLGTSSIGWAVTDESYNVLNKGKKALWGVRLFKESEGASARRGFRSARRRHKREKQRILLLQEIFAQAIHDIDPGFYLRLKESFYIPSDKLESQRNTLFNDSNYTDKQYHEDYPTIYHLRRELMSSDQIHDVRLVYLACQHILKNRGHFYLVGSTFSAEDQYDDAYAELMLVLEEVESPSHPVLAESSVKDRIANILIHSQMTNNDKDKAIQDLSPILKSDKQFRQIVRLILGYKAKLADLLNDEELLEIDRKTVSFKEDYDSMRDDIELDIGDSINFLDTCHAIYKWRILKELLGDSDSISQAQVLKYEQHKEDLKLLKHVLNTAIELDLIGTKFKDNILRANKDKLNNYVAYSGHHDSQTDRKRTEHSCTQEDFHKFIKGEMNKLVDLIDAVEAVDVEKQSVLGQLRDNCNGISLSIDLGDYMPRIRSTDNGVIPQQLNAVELQLILKRASQYLTFLDAETIDKIQQIFAFKIPYYVGPFDTRSEFSWIVRKSMEAITPLNFHEVVDEKKTAIEFIKRMTNKCTYLIGEDVLPKDSLLYSEYVVRNSINMLKVNGEKLSKPLRDAIYETLFLYRTKGGKITKKVIASFLRTEGYSVTDRDITGMDIEIPGKLLAARSFYRILGGDHQLDNRELEDIILHLTALPDSDAMIQEWLLDTYGNRLSDAERDSISKLRFSDWGAFSEKLLNGIRLQGADGRALTVIEIMRDEAVTFMEVLAMRDHTSGKKLSEIIEIMNSEFDTGDTITPETLDDYHLSPSVKKMVWQTLKLCEEIFKIMKGEPKRIFIEMARSKEESKRTQSRQKKLLELYAACRSDVRDWEKEIEGLSDDRLRSKKLYLYYMQKGRCMYSGEPIEIDSLFTPAYDIDHIYPRSKTKDDSFTNLVLVKSVLNRSKSDDLLSDRIRNAQIPFWQDLQKDGFLPETKYERLTRVNPLNEDDIRGFIERQLVETRQMTKAVGSILGKYAKQSRVVYVKASHISDFRYRDGTEDDVRTIFNFPKSRLVNDYHHAKDAYLAIVVGNVYDCKFTNFAEQYQRNHRFYNLRKMYDYPVETANRKAWMPGSDGSIATVQKYMNRNNVLVTHETYRQKGGFYDQMLVAKNGGSGKWPIKHSDLRLHNIEQYGSYNKVTGSHFAIIEHSKGKRRIRTIASVPVLMAPYVNDLDKLEEYFGGEGYINPVVIKNELKYSSIIELDGTRYRLLGKSGTSIKCAGVYQLCLGNDDEQNIKLLERVQDEKVKDLLTDEILNDLYHTLVRKLTTKPYDAYPAMKGQGINMIKSAQSFDDLEMQLKKQVLLSMTSLLQDKGNIIDLSCLTTDEGKKLAKQAGMMTISVNLVQDSTVYLVNQSITGIYEDRELI